MKLNDGGPAFPSSESDDDYNLERGMSLRDHFAGLAMQSVLDRFSPIAIQNDPRLAETVANIAYDVAQAMVDESEKRN